MRLLLSAIQNRSNKMTCCQVYDFLKEMCFSVMYKMIRNTAAVYLCISQIVERTAGTLYCQYQQHFCYTKVTYLGLCVRTLLILRQYAPLKRL